MNKLDWKTLAISLLVLFVVSLLPACFVEQTQLQLGFPAVFYRVFTGETSAYSAHFNPLAFLFDVAVVYAVVYGVKRLHQSILKK